MKEPLLFLIILFILTAFDILQGQEAYYGKLMKARLDDNEFYLVDSAAKLEYSGIRLYYTNKLKAGSGEYFLLKYEQDAPDNSPILCEYKLSVDDFTSNPDYANNPVYSFNKMTMDIIPPYTMEEPHVVELNSGAWIMSGYLGNAYLAEEGTLYNFSHVCSDSTLGLYIQDVIGKAGGLYIGVFADIHVENYYYYLVDLDQSPYIDSLTAKRLYFPDEYIPMKIEPLGDSLYLAATYSSMDILKLRDVTFEIVESFPETTIPELLPRNWAFRNNKLLVRLENYNLTRFDFNPLTKKFGEPETIEIEQDYLEAAYDQELRYGAFIDGDTVRIYDVDREEFTNAVFAPGVRPPEHLFLDSQYVYIHTIDMIIGVEDDNSPASLTYKLSAYPNPFNPQTTIAFTIANAGKVELAVYDLLGRKVTELLNEYRDKGSYEVKFNGANLASGIYFYTIKAGNFIKTNKLLLLK